jgi:hypothetical protein
MKEVWKDIEGYEGQYQVSNLGNVKSLNRFVYQLDRSGKPSISNYKGRVLKFGHRKNGYLYIVLSKNNKQKKENIHRLVAKAFIPNPLNKPQVNHKDGNKKNNLIGNLEWNTMSENHKHAFRTGLRSNKRSTTIESIGDLSLKKRVE